MIKKAIGYLLEEDEKIIPLDINSWRLTDSEITYNFLLKHKKSREIMQRVLLCRPFTCLGIFYIKGKGAAAFINNHLVVIEDEVREFLLSKIGKTKEKDADFFENHPVFANFYPDKRKRSIRNLKNLWYQQERIQKDEKKIEGALLGLFTPYGNSFYIEQKEDDQKKCRKLVSIRKEAIEEILKKGILKNFEISLYGSEGNDKPDTDFKPSQLGFF